MKTFFRLIRNKYVLVTLVFVVLVGFVDNNNLIRTYKTRREIRELENKKEHYLKEIEKTRIIWEDLTTNPMSFEKFARETYFLKKPQEDIYIIEVEE